MTLIPLSLSLSPPIYRWQQRRPGPHASATAVAWCPNTCPRPTTVASGTTCHLHPSPHSSATTGIWPPPPAQGPLQWQTAPAPAQTPSQSAPPATQGPHQWQGTQPTSMQTMAPGQSSAFTHPMQAAAPMQPTAQMQTAIPQQTAPMQMGLPIQQSPAAMNMQPPCSQHPLGKVHLARIRRSGRPLGWVSKLGLSNNLVQPWYWRSSHLG